MIDVMPTFKIYGRYLQGNAFEYWTQDPEGMAKTLREQGHFVSTNVVREDPPRVGNDVTSRRKPPPCPCACNSGGFCGGCGHAGCGG